MTTNRSAWLRSVVPYGLGALPCLPLVIVSFFAGAIWQSHEVHLQRIDERTELLKPLTQDPRFSNLEINYSSNGEVRFNAADVSKVNMPALEHEVIQILGRDVAEHSLATLKWKAQEAMQTRIQDDSEPVQD